MNGTPRLLPTATARRDVINVAKILIVRGLLQPEGLELKFTIDCDRLRRLATASSQFAVIYGDIVGGSRGSSAEAIKRVVQLLEQN